MAIIRLSRFRPTTVFIALTGLLAATLILTCTFRPSDPDPNQLTSWFSSHVSGLSDIHSKYIQPFRQSWAGCPIGEEEDIENIDPVRKVKGWSSGDDRIDGLVDGWAAKKKVLEDQFGQRFFQKSVAYKGTNTRVRHVLRKLIRGEPIVITNLGGSISAGANTPDSGITKDPLFVFQLMRLINETFPHNGHRLLHKALGGLGSGYYSWCLWEYIDAQSDLVIIDHSHNDQQDIVDARTFEKEVRSILEAPGRMALLSLEYVSLNWGFDRMSTASGYQVDACRFYDVPFLSLRNPLLPEFLAHPERLPLFYGRDSSVNLGHVSYRGHWGAAAMTAHYFYTELIDMAQREILNNEPEESLPRSEADRNILNVDESILQVTGEDVRAWELSRDPGWKEESQWGSELYYNDVPRLGLNDKYDFATVRPTAQPRCDAIEGTRQKLRWETVELGRKVDEQGIPTNQPGEGWTEFLAAQSVLAKYYVYTNSSESTVRFPIEIVGDGNIAVTYLRSLTLGLGKVDCWVDDDRSHAVELNGEWDIPHNLGRTTMIREGLPSGGHSLFCHVKHKSEFRIIAIMTS